MKFSEDSSLQGWGHNLRGAEEAAEEVAAAYAAAEAKADAFRHVFGKTTQQGATDLPADHQLVADMEATHTAMQDARESSLWRRIGTELAALPAMYRNRHEVDEARLAGGRGGVTREKRADVGYAQQDT